MIILGEIRQFAVTPNASIWMPCQGQRLQVSQNQALYYILANTFGGNLGIDFNIPDYNGDINPSNKPLYYIAIAGEWVDENKLTQPMAASKAIADAKFNI